MGRNYTQNNTKKITKNRKTNIQNKETKRKIFEKHTIVILFYNEEYY